MFRKCLYIIYRGYTKYVKRTDMIHNLVIVTKEVVKKEQT